MQPQLTMKNATFYSLLVSAVFTAVAPAAVDFEKEVWPFMKERCVDCHKAPFEENGKKKEPKAGLRLDGAWAILKGSENGVVLKPGDSAKSSLFEAVTLPKDDDAHMPPKGDSLTDAQIKVLKQWIDEGAKFGSWEGNIEGRPAQPTAAAVAKREHVEFYKALEAGAKPIAADVLKAATAAGAQVSTISGTSPLVRADFLTGVSKADDARIATALLPMANNIAQLDLGRTVITDAALVTVAKLPRLARLDLRQTKITDAGLRSLSGLTKLQVLNLFGTEITDSGVEALTSIKSLKHVFLTQTKATEAGAKRLQAALPGVNVVLK
jgi:Planctomycete cytochrome C/Leucine Rich repeat